MKNYILSLACFIVVLNVFSQKEEELGVLQSDTTWKDEIIKFPIGFAPELKYKGFEDLRFAYDWRDQNSEDFWCYVFVWHVEGIQKLTIQDLEEQIGFYYDGLMKAVNKKKDFKVPETKVEFIKTDNSETDFIGKIEVYDSFNIEDIIILNVQVKSYFCQINKTTNIMFKLSPQPYNKAIWTRFNEVKIRKDVCDN